MPHTMSPRWLESGEIDFCERLSAYGEGGLCPVLPGDVLGGSDLLGDGSHCSFKIRGKLGKGTYSTVWLGEDVSHCERFLAVKVLRQDASTADNHEMHILNRLGMLKAAFFYAHPRTQNNYLCLGTEPLGASLPHRIDAFLGPPGDIPSITTFAKTLLVQVLAIHQQGICHGDISPSNVFLGLHNDALTPEGLEEAFGQDQESRPVYFDGTGYPEPQPALPANFPEYMVSHLTPLRSDAVDMSRVVLTDFGKSFSTPSKKNVLGTHLYHAPEMDREGENTATTKSDLWSLGCVIFNGLTNSELFHSTEAKDAYDTYDYNDQVSGIAACLEYYGCRVVDPEYLRMLGQLIQSLVRFDPATRDPAEAMRIIKLMEAYYSSLEKECDDEPGLG